MALAERMEDGKDLEGCRMKAIIAAAGLAP